MGALNADVDDRSVLTSKIRAQASTEFNPWTAEIFPSAEFKFDHFEMPTEWHKIIKLCYYFYEREGLVKSVIDKQVEISMNGLNILSDNMDDESRNLFSYVMVKLMEFLSIAATEYYISGLVVPEVVWGTLTKEISGLTKDYEIPMNIWIRDPSQVELKSTPLPNHVIPVWKVPDEDLVFIKGNGVYSDGTEDKETFELLKKSFPDFVRDVKKGKTSFVLSGRHVIRRKPLLRNPYPIPYLMSALELLIHKRNLRAMDYAMISRVIDAILHVKVGNDTFPLTEEDDDIIDELQSQFNRNRNVNNQERVFQFFTNHTVEISWVIPPLDALLDSGKYAEINQEILYSLGFPKFLVTGEKDKSNTGSTSSALLSPVNSMTAVRNEFALFLNAIFIEMSSRNSFSEVPAVSFAPLNLVELSELIQLSLSLESSGVISKSSLAKLAGFDFKSEQMLRKDEEEYFVEVEVDEESDTKQQNPDST